METNLTVRLQAIENELLRMRLNMQDRACNVYNTIQYNYFIVSSHFI